MKQKIISTAHTLTLWPAKNVLSFSQLTNGVSIVTKGEPYKIDITPGSLMISENVDNDGVYTKKIKFIVPYPDVNTRNKLRTMADARRFVATYIDDTGAERVAGSPNYPLSLSFEYSGGLVGCSLQGKTTDVDAYTL